MAATITQESLSDKVYTIIKQQILSGELKGGTLLSEEAFAEQFGVSRTPIREALRRLNEYGLVKLKPHSQAVVHKVDEKEFADITRLRITLETLVVESLLKLRAKDYIGNLYDLADQCSDLVQIGSRARLFVKDSQFHLELARSTGNKALFDLYNRLDSKVQLLRIAQNLDESNLAQTIQQHYRLLTALENHDEQASLAFIGEHIRHASLG